MASGNDGDVICRDGCGNGSIAHAVTEPSQVERIYETVPETPQITIIDEMMQEICETSDLEEEGKQSEKGSPVQKRGRRKGSGASLKLTVGEWYCACETYLALPMKMSPIQFLRFNRSNPKLTGTRSQQCCFSQMLKKFKK